MDRRTASCRPPRRGNALYQRTTRYDPKKHVEASHEKTAYIPLCYPLLRDIGHGSDR